ncbi:after-VIT domain-containing protein [Limnoraphis robusta]|uniref:After-VIT domain-containing protein n=2 Tax=Limnoraphis TaxID=1332112 RepID=A0ABU5TWI4_9CYAN|nr:after-VIT domain-containing protein [Limnoraphis robusta]MEA5519260.1 after-VIT domain-containing protein [Limnoraphis robusta CCNP1315]MEA5547129.1 after-VIT domain-containing protein [Limnoraphis robusta CCNP1324]
MSVSFMSPTDVCFADWSRTRDWMLKYSLASEAVSPLQVIDVTGLDTEGIDSLKNHLKTLEVPAEFMGELVFELQVKKDRIRRVLWDEKASTLNKKTIIKMIQNALKDWIVPDCDSEILVLRIHINS